MPPYFSIIIPMYNRERYIARAIDSCLRQDFVNFEIIVVDDGSIDKSVEIVKRYVDPRIKLICHAVNRGVGPARNTGIESATGEWIICLDSDDELLPGALNIIYKRSLEVNNDVARLQFMVQMDTGEFSPDPPLKHEFWDYIKYIKWMETCYGRPSEMFPVVRRKTFEKVKYYNDRTLEMPYHLDFMKHFNAYSFPDVVRLYHHDADNQLIKPNTTRIIEGAKDQAFSGELVLKNHGESLKKYAPKVYERNISGLATLFFISGYRMIALKYSLTSLKNNILSIKNWVILLVGILGPKPLAFVKFLRNNLFHSRSIII